MARWTSAAATAESTPPDRPHIARPSPTWAAIQIAAARDLRRHRSVANRWRAGRAQRLPPSPRRRTGHISRGHRRPGLRSRSEQPVIYEDTGQSRTDGALDERSGYRRVHAAGQATYRAAIADLGCD